MLYNWRKPALVVKIKPVSPFQTLSPTLVRLPLAARPCVVNCGLAEHGFRGQERYELPRLWCMHLYFYTVEMETHGVTHRIVPGSLTLVPPASPIVYHYGARKHRHFFVHFRADEGVESMEEGAPARVEIPLLQHLPQAQDEILDRLQHMHRVLTHNRLHAEILFWSLLWDIAHASRTLIRSGDRGSALLKSISAFIEERLPSRITVQDIAEHLNLSSPYINRIVKRETGATTIQLIRRHRMQRAHRLLLHSTMPIKLIAAECGVDDLHHFNKLIHHEYGASPRHLRLQSASAAGPGKGSWAVERE
ncbi:hypothetical protein DB346_05060 [Verrucomicrobia bacterium LW23]|nr:hypothetical protein DB346_05060 [Verrucomicrobia bacterium LW23]